MATIELVQALGPIGLLIALALFFFLACVLWENRK